jgi:hypothetical protein
MLKVFVPEFDYQKGILFEIFCLSPKQGIAISQVGEEYFSLVNSPLEADWVMIPIFITGLTSDSDKKFIHQTHDLAKEHGKPFGVFSNSDLISNPGVDQVFIFSPGAYRSFNNLIDLPAILPFDPVQKWFDNTWVPVLKFDTPSLGFCGQATVNPLKTVKDWMKIESLRAKKKFGNAPYLHIPRFLPALERGLLLRYLESVKGLKTDFILRTKYKGGALTLKKTEEVERDFFNNIRNNLFTVCLRGFGNYSVRFFQTLAMGRIPILIDTDSSIPFQKYIGDEEFFVRVPYIDRKKTEQYVKEFMNKRSDQDLIRLQERCREIWQEFYQIQGMIRFVEREMRTILLEKYPIN